MGCQMDEISYNRGTMDMDEIIEKAEEVAQEYNPQTLSPFPYENILDSKKDLQIYLATMDMEISGAIGWNTKDKKFEIFVNKEKPQNRQNFTLAHELGHYFLHQEIIQKEDALIDSEDILDSNTTLFRNDVVSSSEIEKEANNFAASLLMPSDLVKKVWNAFKNVEECAKLFQVSVVAMSIRLERLGLVT